MAFMKEPEPERGVAHEVADGVLRLVARNPGIMTYHGTNTYLIEDKGGFLVLDPGPATDPQHIDDILQATGGRIAAVLLSHGHTDHIGALDELCARADAPSYAYRTPIVEDFVPSVKLDDGDTVFGLTAIFTPGHAADHLCFARGDGLVFTGDHIMTWSSSVVSPPGGNMEQFVASLKLMIDRNDPSYLPGHGPRMDNPRDYVRDLMQRRIDREEAIYRALQRRPLSPSQLSRTLYSKTDPLLQMAAERNVLSHLAKLEREGRVVQRDDVWTAVPERHVSAV
jgi:glyoxylase-like metal-dependent hydrolase (beta-lactamase superfamily II)